MVSGEIELSRIGIKVGEPLDFIEKGAFERKNRLVVIEEEGDVGIGPAKSLDKLYLNPIEILCLINQDVAGRNQRSSHDRSDSRAESKRSS